jgi:hypothetical protein
VPEIGIADIERLAEEAANLFCIKETNKATSCFEEACQLGGPFIASTTFVSAFAQRAAQARLADDRGGVSRLKENAYNLRPDIFSKQDVNDIFKAAGACGHKSPARRLRLKNYSAAAMVYAPD